jgi:IS4 transposase
VAGAWEKCPYPLRRVEVWDAKKEEVLVFLANHYDFGASTISALYYKERWQIELFSKALKQNLKIKTFVGTSANAVKIQVWTALIAMLILRYLKLKSKFSWSLSNLVALADEPIHLSRPLGLVKPTFWDTSTR